MVALGAVHRGSVQLKQLQQFETLSSFQEFLQQPAPEGQACVGGFDLPVGVPREWVEAVNWPRTWPECMDRFAAHSREELRQLFKSFCDARPAGSKFAHRKTDLPAGSSPSMKWVNPPVAWMMHAGVPLLRQAAWTLPGSFSRSVLRCSPSGLHHAQHSIQAVARCIGQQSVVL